MGRAETVVLMLGKRGRRCAEAGTDTNTLGDFDVSCHVAVTHQESLTLLRQSVVR